MALRALFLDFNSYFASVEQQAQPHLRGKPVAVAPVTAETTCCIAASYEAKRFGVRTGTPIWQARQMCPRLQVVPARPRLYVEYHHRLVAAVENCVHVSQVLSIDEMWCELSGAISRRERAEMLARQIKQTIAREVGEYLKCSIGIAPNIFLAKTATELQKPNGLVVIEPDDLPHCLHVLQLRDLCGIGSRMEKRLRQNGITTVEGLCGASRHLLRYIWGSVEGERFYQNLRGEWLMRPPTQRGSISHSHILPPDLRSETGARAVLCRLLQKAATRMRSMELATGGQYIFVKHIGAPSWNDKRHFPHTDDTPELTSYFCEMWQSREDIGLTPLGVGVVLYALRPVRDCTLPLLSTHKNRLHSLEQRRALNRAIDELNERYGRTKIYLGGAHLAIHTAQSRIAFNHIPEIDGEHAAEESSLYQAPPRSSRTPRF